LFLFFTVFALGKINSFLQTFTFGNSLVFLGELLKGGFGVPKYSPCFCYGLVFQFWRLKEQTLEVEFYPFAS